MRTQPASPKMSGTGAESLFSMSRFSHEANLRTSQSLRASGSCSKSGLTRPCTSKRWQQTGKFRELNHSCDPTGAYCLAVS
jgi:hypothetical protein